MQRCKEIAVGQRDET